MRYIFREVLLPMLPELPLSRRCRDEQELLGFPHSAHPLQLLPAEVWQGVTPAAEMEKLPGRPVTMIGWMIAQKLIRTRKGRRRFMKFLSMEDLSGTFEVTLFPDAYQRFAPLTVTAGPFRIRGRIENDQGVPALNATSLELLPLPGFTDETN